MTRITLLAGVLCLAFSTQQAYSQLLYGSVVGNVKDPSQAAIAGANVALTNLATNETRETVTSETGSYSFPTLNPGTYDIRVTRDGFRTSQTQVIVTINSVTRADLALQLGTVAESVMVEATAATLQTDRSEVRQEITSKQFENLPVATGRNYQQLFRTLPGFRPPTNAHSVPTNPSRALTTNVNGVSQSINNTKIDGASSIQPWLPHASAFIPTLESLETVNVVTNSFDAEQGLAGGAAVNVQIKSGTNDIHGSAFEYYTGNRLKAKPFFLPQGQDNPKLVYNEYGGTLGGPIKKDKLFYFMSYEGTADHQFASRFATVPTAAMKRGDFSESPRGLFDPATGDGNGLNRMPFANKTVPASRMSPITLKLNALIPDQNLSGISNNYFKGGSYAFDRHRADTKVNYIHSQKTTAFGRFSLLHYDMNNPQVFGDLGGDQLSGAGGNPGYGFGNTYSFTGAVTHVFKPTFIMDAYYGYTRIDTAVEQSRLDEKLGLDFLGIPGTNGSRQIEGGWPRFNIDGFSVLGVPNAFQPYYRRDPQYQYVANFNWTKGAHEIRFGTDLYSTHMNHNQPEAPGAFHGAQGGFTFSGGLTLLRVRNANGGLGVFESSNQYNAYAAFLLGMPRLAGKITQRDDEYSTRSFQHSYYIRDRWNVNRKLTLSYGLRWEYFPFPTRKNGGLEVYDPATNKMRLCGVGVVPLDCGIQESKTKFAPRFGFAYRATDTLVIRAGYGLTNDPFSLARPFRTNYPMLLVDNLQGANDFVAYNPQGISAGIPRVVPPDSGNGIIDIPGSFAAFTVADKFRRGYVQSWNLTIQKQLPSGFIAQAGYVATRSTSAMGWININAGQVIGAGTAGQPLRAKFGRNATTTAVEPFGTNMYDSLQATLSRRFSKGMSLNVAYTWSKVIGYQDNNDSGPAVHARAYFDRNRTVRGYDIPHNLAITNIWELPFGDGQRFANSGPAKWILGGWQINNVFAIYSGTPFSVGSGGASLNMANASQTADQVKPNVAILGGVGRGQAYFDPFAFAPVTEARFGNTGYNILRGPGVFNWDFGLHRRFKISERFDLQFRGEAFNFTNTPHFNNPGTNVSNFNPNQADPLRRFGGYSEITSTRNLGRDGFDERQVRIGLRLGW
ncbi:MAG: carboxypeptidase regulatory-like domain-containing protein [Bryobacteraceae bacterium]